MHVNLYLICYYISICILNQVLELSLVLALADTILGLDRFTLMKYVVWGVSQH